MSAHLVIILKYPFFIICTNTPICINSVIFTHLVIIFKYLFFIIYLIVSLTRLERWILLPSNVERPWERPIQWIMMCAHVGWHWFRRRRGFNAADSRVHCARAAWVLVGVAAGVQVTEKPQRTRTHNMVHQRKYVLSTIQVRVISLTGCHSSILRQESAQPCALYNWSSNTVRALQLRCNAVCALQLRYNAVCTLQLRYNAVFTSLVGLIWEVGTVLVPCIYHTNWHYKLLGDGVGPM